MSKATRREGPLKKKVFPAPVRGFPPVKSPSQQHLGILDLGLYTRIILPRVEESLGPVMSLSVHVNGGEVNRRFGFRTTLPGKSVLILTVPKEWMGLPVRSVEYNRIESKQKIFTWVFGGHFTYRQEQTQVS